MNINKKLHAYKLLLKSRRDSAARDVSAHKTLMEETINKIERMESNIYDISSMISTHKAYIEDSMINAIGDISCITQATSTEMMYVTQKNEISHMLINAKQEYEEQRNILTIKEMHLRKHINKYEKIIYMQDSNAL